MRNGKISDISLEDFIKANFTPEEIKQIKENVNMYLQYKKEDHGMQKQKSCIKWTGGKFRELDMIIPLIPDDFETYVEPFVGGGALFWTLAFNYNNKIKYHINDANTELVNFYKVLQQDYHKLIKNLSYHSHNKEYFSNIRKEYNTNKNLSHLDRASIFYFLNKTAFSGKYRINADGEYNNSWGNYKNITWDKIPIEYHNNLQEVKISNKCALDILCQYQDNPDAFIFLDPPYYNSDSMYGNIDNKDLNQLYKGIYKSMKHQKLKY